MLLQLLYGWSKTHEYRVGNATQPFYLIRKADDIVLRHDRLTLVEIPLAECRDPHKLSIDLSKEVKKKFGIRISLDVADLMELCS